MLNATKRSLEALLRGYLLFRVNGKYYFTYSAGLKARKETQGDVKFEGLHICGKWYTFFMRTYFTKKG